MRVDPEKVYLELTSESLIVSLPGKTRIAPSAVLHWKNGRDRRWHRRIFIAEELETIGSVLRNLGTMIDSYGGLEEALTRIDGRIRQGKRIT